MTRVGVDRTIALPVREIRTRLGRRARRAGVQLSPGLVSGLVAYLELLARWNHKINLTSLPLEEPTDETFDRLLIEPVIAARHLPSSRCSVIDIGSGGGSPAIPLKMAAPAVSLRMVESKARKTAFLREAIRRLGLEDVVVESARFEELLAEPGLHEAHDVAMLRAVRVEARTLITAQAFLRFNGRVFLFRSSAGAMDLPANVPVLTLEAVYPLSESLGSRLVVLRKPKFR